MKQVMVMFNFQGATARQYDDVMKELNSTGILSDNGLIFHSCGVTSKGLTVFDIWESEESLSKFGETLFPLLKKYKINAVQPEIIKLHNMVSNLVPHS